MEAKQTVLGNFLSGIIGMLTCAFGGVIVGIFVGGIVGGILNHFVVGISIIGISLMVGAGVGGIFSIILGIKNWKAWWRIIDDWDNQIPIKLTGDAAAEFEAQKRASPYINPAGAVFSAHEAWISGKLPPSGLSNLGPRAGDDL